MDIIDLGEKAKKQYPGQFDDLSNWELGKQLKENNPGKYDEYDDVPVGVTHKNVKATPRSAIAKAITGLGSIVGVGASALTKKVASPIAQHFTKDEDIKQKLQALSSPENKNTAYLGDVVEQVLPDIFKFKPVPTVSAEEIKKRTPAQADSVFAANTINALTNVGKFGGRVAIDMAGDPLNWVSFGASSRLGRLLRMAHEANQAGEPIKLSGPLAKAIAREVGAAKPSAAMVQKFLKQIPAKGFSKQVASKERSLLALANPIGEGNIPLLTGPKVAKVLAPLDAVGKTVAYTKLDHLVRRVFSNESGNPDFDILIGKAKSIAAHRAGLAIEDASTLNKNMQDISRETGIPREVLDAQFREIGEAIKVPTKAMSKQKYGAAYDALDAHYQDKLVDAKISLVNAQKAGDANAVDLAAKQVADYQGELNKLHGKYTPPSGINPKLEAQVRQVKDANARQLLDQEAVGLPGKPLMADVEYMTHAMTNETRASMNAQAEREGRSIPSKNTKEMNTQLANTIRRQIVKVKPTVIDAWKEAGIISKRDAKVIKGKNGIGKLDELLDSGAITEAQYPDAVHTLTIDEVQNLPLELKQKIFGQDIKADTQIFHSDPVYSSAIRAVRGARAITAAEFFNAMKKRGLALPDNLAPADWVNVKTSELAGHKVDPQIARVLNRWNEFVTNPKEFQDALNVYDTFHGLTKAWTLGVFPGYHTKNMVGNFWNNWLAGLNNPDRYREAAVLQHYERTGKGKVRFDNVLGGQWTEKELVQKLKELGVIGQGQFGGDIQRTIKQQIENGEFRWKDLVTPSQRNLFLRTGFKVGKAIEDNARIAHFIDRLRKGDTAEAAALSVKKYLFDYGDLTDIERNLLNRIFFFYSWTRKNLPLQLHALVTTPWKFGALYKTKHELEKNTPAAPEKYLPEYMKENFPLRVRYDSKNKQYEYFMLNNWLPAADLLKIVHIHDIAAQSLAPLPKELIQQLWNYDFYFKKQISNVKGQNWVDKLLGADKTRMFGKVDIPSKLAHGMKAIRLLNEIDKMSKQDADLLTKMVGIATGKNQVFDPQQARIQNALRVKNDIEELTSQLYREGNKKPMNKAEIQKIRAMIKEKAKEF